MAEDGAEGLNGAVWGGGRDLMGGFGRRRCQFGVIRSVKLILLSEGLMYD
jgi:hypothetical protein